MKKKTGVIVSSAAVIALCSSIIAGSTYALFTDSSSVDISVKSAKVDVTATIDSATLYSAETIDTETYAVSYKKDAEGKELPTKELPATGSNIALTEVMPGDKFVLGIKIESDTSIDYNYRVSVLQKSGDNSFYENLLVGVDGVYYSDYVSDWTLVSAATKEINAEVEIILPAYLTNDFSDKVCELAFKVEAVQSNASVNNATNKRVYPVYSQADLNNALETIATENATDTTLVLMQKWDNVEIVYDEALNLDVKGCDVNNIMFDADKLTAEYLIENTGYIDVQAVDYSSLYIYGSVNALDIKQGHVVAKTYSAVEEVTFKAAEEKAIFEADDGVAIKKVSNEGNVAKVTLSVAGETKPEISEDLLTGGVVAVDGKVEVASEQALINAVANGGNIEIVTDFNVSKTIEIVKPTTINGNGHSIVSSASRILWIDSSDVEVNLVNVKLLRNGNNAVERAVQINPDKTGVKLNIDGCTLEASFYTINICNNAEVYLTITNSEITGWGAINAWSDGYSIHVRDSVLRGVNDKGYSAEGWNGFGTVVIEGDTTYKTDDAAESVDVELVNCRIIAESKTGNIQKCILFNAQSKGNRVNVVGCTLELENDNCIEYIDNGTDNVLTMTDNVTINRTAIVSNKEELAAALENEEVYTVKLANDITLDGGANVAIARPVVLEGNGFILTASGFTGENYSIINVTACDGTVEIKNLKAVSNETVAYMRGLNISGTQNLSLNLTNVTVEMPDYYALNITLYNRGLTVNAENITMSAWGAIKNHSSGVTFTAKDSTFIGLNPHNSPNSSGNYFTTIIPASYVLYDSDEFVEDYLSANNTFTFEKCTIIARIGNNEDGTPLDTQQSLIDIRSPYNNVVNLNNCEFVADGGNDKIMSAYDSVYVPEENRDDSEFVLGTNKIFINGTDSTDDESVVEKYLDE